MKVRPSSRSRRSARPPVALVVLAVLVAVVWVLLSIGSTSTRRTIVLATGPQGSACSGFGPRYRQILQRSGFDLLLVPTNGGVDNLARLRDPHSGVNAAFVESGLTNREESPDLVSLGTVTLEPLWTFFRGQSQGTVAQQLKGKRISIEPEGSATRMLVRQFLALNNVDESSVELLGLAPEQSAEALIRGKIDVAFMLTSWQSPAVQELLHADGIVLVNHPRADAYVALSRNLVKVMFPMGLADLARNIPPADVQLLAQCAT